MEWYIVLLIIFGSLVALMVIGLPVAFSFLLVNLLGVLLLWGGLAGLEQLIWTMWNSVASFVYLPIVMFVLLGEILFRSGMALNAMDAMNKWLGRLPGRLGLLAVVMSTIFAAMSGSSVATVAALGPTLVPEMEKRGYKSPISIGSVMGTAGLALLIPPSTLAVIWAVVAETSVGRILISGIIPGLILACFYVIYIIVRCHIQPSIAPVYDVVPMPLSKKLKGTIKYVLPFSFIMFMVTGLILLGIATPSEAAVMGVLGGLGLAIVYRQLNWELVRHSLLSTVMVSVMVLLIMSGAKAFSNILAFTGSIRELVTLVISLPVAPMIVIIGMMVIVLFLGMFMSAIPVIMITIPIFMPIVLSLGFDPVWFGLIFLINSDMGGSTPPFGMLLFTMKGIAPPGTTMRDIVSAGIPFLICDVAVMALVMAFPILALWLPGLIL